MAQDNGTAVAPDTLPADFNAWDSAPDTLPSDFNFGDKPGFDERLRSSMQKGAENFAHGTVDSVKKLGEIPGHYRDLFNDPLGTLKQDASNAVDEAKGIAKGAVDYGKSVMEDPANLGQAVTQFGIPAVAGAAIGEAAFRPSAEARIAAQQANADPLKLLMLKAGADAKKNLNLKMANVTGAIDKSPAMVPRTTVYSQLTKYFGDKMESAPLDVSRLIGDAQRPTMSSSPGSMTNVAGQVTNSSGNMTFGQLENLRQTIGDAMSVNRTGALKGAYKEVSGFLNQLAKQQGLEKEYSAAVSGLEDFHTNVIPKGGLIDSATASTAEDYKSIMKPLSSPALKSKVEKLKQLGANIDYEKDVATRVRAYKIYEKSGSAIGMHSLRPQSLLEAVGGAAGYGVGGSMGHPIIGAELGIQAARGIRNSPFDPIE